MKRILTLLCMFVLVTSMQAQKKKAISQPRLPQITLEEALAQYDFDSAEKLLNNEIATLKKRKQPTLQQESKLQWLHKAQIKLNAVERVTFVDSLVVLRQDVLSHIHLNPECGSLHHLADVFHVTDTLDCTAFKSEMGDQVFFAQPDNQGSISLYMRDIYGDGSSSDAILLNGISNGEEHQNYPFMLTDGTTIYFAAQGAESLGGYDIFMSRYDADEHRFLTPENIGMPFNSLANDYLYVIDELNHLGWFVTDRNMPADSVCIYTFIPNETRQVYVPEEMEPGMLRERARITSIRDTWTDEQTLRAAQFRIREAMATKQAETDSEFDFVVTDNRVYHRHSDFRSDIAQKHFDSWLYAKSELEKTRRTLARLRQNYHQATASQRQQMTGEILSLEQSEETLLGKIKQLEKDMRKAEIGL
ncbi:MAG: hypothetical protein IJ197_05340 [Bacteroidaceae bacterium]|nr:hypothetical protein [Bacteroidaceae bacterium]